VAQPLGRSSGRRSSIAGSLLGLLGALLIAGSAMAVDPSVSPSPAPSADPSTSPGPPADPSATAAPDASPIAFGPAVASGATPLTGPVAFHGRGYGHGIGLSQYGARGRALAGQDMTTILAHYYPGTSVAAVDPAIPVRVLVLSGFSPTSKRPFLVYGRAGAWSIDGIGALFPADASLRLTRTGRDPASGRYLWRAVVAAASGVLADQLVSGPLRIRPSEPTAHLQLWSKPTTYDRYEGDLVVHLSSRATVVNVVPLDTYLRGVVPAEMPSTWPLEALKAQTIAARSYAARRIRTTGSWDLTDTTSSQVYRGLRGARATTDAAISATAGLVLMSGSSIAATLYHSTGGGATEANENVYTTATGRRTARPVAYLRGGGDRAPDGTAYDSASPHATWSTATYSLEELSAMFAADPRTDTGLLLALDLRDRGSSGRLVSVTLIGTSGTRTVSGNVFRAVFNAHRAKGQPSLRSTLIDLAPIP
jgi:stage II sporulation protein D